MHRPKYATVARLLCAMVCMATAVVMPSAASSSSKGAGRAREPVRQLQAAKLHEVENLKQGIDFFRRATWHWQDAVGAPRTRTSYIERHVSAKPYLKWVVKLWQHRWQRAKHYAQSIVNNRGYLPPAQARLLGRYLAAQQGWTGEQWGCLDRLWGTKDRQTLESGWSATADNPHSEAHGIPQANPGSKMAAFGRNWLKSAYVQIRWGLYYIKSNRNFHTPCEALQYRLAHGSY